MTEVPFKSSDLQQVAICYDFDETLSPGNLPEHELIKALGYDPEDFVKEISEYTHQHQTDYVLGYMKWLVDEAKKKGFKMTHDNLVKCGKHVPLFPGLITWFDRINAYGKSIGLEVNHYIISSGLLEIIEGTQIYKHFKKAYASSYLYDKSGAASWPAMAINYTTKTQYLYRINKGCLDPCDPRVNAYMPEQERPTPAANMIYIGDGETDIPCMTSVRGRGGQSLAVYQSEKPHSVRIAQLLLKDNRINDYAPANYSSGSEMETKIKACLDHIADRTKIPSEL